MEKNLIEGFCNRLAEQKVSPYCIFKELIEVNLKKQDVLFLMGYVQDGTVYIYDEGKNEWQDCKLEGKKELNSYFKKLNDKDEVILEYFGLIGREYSKSSEEDPILTDIYCYVAINQACSIDMTYLHIVCQNYFKWTAYYFTEILRITLLSDYSDKSDTEKKRQKFFRDCHELFVDYIKKIYSIDLEIITRISGSYYESSSCCSRIVFWLSDLDPDLEQRGITFQDDIKVCSDNVRKIRKLLQMGGEKQCLLAHWDKENQNWKVKGLYLLEDIDQPYLAFHMIQHMVWQMDVRGQIAVCYKCGKYIVESEELEILKIEKKYKSTFGILCEERMKQIFREAIGQRHGTILVVWDQEPEDKMDEVERLQECSTGFGIVAAYLEPLFIRSATSIDGAVFVDKTGKCYGIGVILDGKSGKGESKWGTRHNSAQRYVDQCKEKGQNMLAVVVSEDRTVQVISTKDDKEGHGHGKG